MKRNCKRHGIWNSQAPERCPYSGGMIQFLNHGTSTWNTAYDIEWLRLRSPELKPKSQRLSPAMIIHIPWYCYYINCVIISSFEVKDSDILILFQTVSSSRQNADSWHLPHQTKFIRCVQFFNSVSMIKVCWLYQTRKMWFLSHCSFILFRYSPLSSGTSQSSIRPSFGQVAHERSVEREYGSEFWVSWYCSSCRFLQPSNHLRTSTCSTAPIWRWVSAGRLKEGCFSFVQSTSSYSEGYTQKSRWVKRGAAQCKKAGVCLRERVGQKKRVILVRIWSQSELDQDSFKDSVWSSLSEVKCFRREICLPSKELGLVNCR